MQKQFTTYAILILVGIFLGGVGVYGYYGLEQSPEKEDTEESLSGACKLENLNEEELDIQAASAYLKFKKIRGSFTPSGVPDIYGEELGISFDRVQEAIDKVKIYGLTYGEKKINLTEDELKRYIDIGLMISCEYCCGVDAITREDGEAACGCAHSQMMRGLTAYLIKNHAEMSNEQILEELETWKITYFPKQTLSKELNKLKDSGETGIQEILEEFPDFLPEMIGGC
ncbi:hypothetical protein KKA24_03385 [Patescibacteria group bacterium]|nr:hypothetical protein [Patescibacteria group bacterium]